MNRRWIAFFLLASTTGFAASFDCAKAKTTQEKAICASPELSDLDDQMAAAYQALLKIAPLEYAAAVREDQRGWLNERALKCGPKLDEEKLQACLKDEYKSRIPELRVETKQKGGVLFVWRAIVVTAPDEPGELPESVNEVNPGFGTLAASWPQASMATPEWTVWNKAMEDAARKATLQLTGSATSVNEWAAEAYVDTETTVSINSVSRSVVSATIGVLWDGHGAHPNHGTTEFNWLLKEKRAVLPDDVFLASTDWKAWMQARIDKYLHKALDPQQIFLKPAEMAQKLDGIVQDSSRWKLDERGLTVTFQPYELTCYACTPEPMTIPWIELKPYLNPRFEIPRQGEAKADPSLPRLRHPTR